MAVRITLQAVEGLPTHKRMWHRLLMALRLRQPAPATHKATVILRAW